MQSTLPKFKKAGVQVVAISYDSVEILGQFAQKREITFPLLSDPKSDTIKAYKLFNPDTKGKLEGIPYPGTIVVGKDGKVIAKLFHEGYRERHTGEEILAAVKETEDAKP